MAILSLILDELAGISGSTSSTSAEPEYLTIVATDTSVGANFSTYTTDTIKDVVIQNTDISVGAYVTWSATAPPTATSNMTFLNPGASVCLSSVKHIYFAAISATSASVTVRITGAG